ncbi:MAG: NifB/NifX family molybdenum-iron cluster-binding protein [Elusimicrobiales bacterium]
MKIGITLNDDQGLKSEVCAHFGQCSHFLIVEAEGDKIKESKVVVNTAVHGGGGCTAVTEILKYGITHVIAGGMGAGAQNKFAAADVPIFGYSGKAEDAVKALLQSKLGGIDPCKDHGHDGECAH